ncbi:MAG: hypothetical protein RL653_1734 [Pseudomonadota bacterium]|jgi:hypothetical protein
MSSPAPSYQPYLEQLTAWATAEDRRADLVAARTAYFQATGEVFEDDKQFEPRMASFLEHYLFDRPHPETGLTPAQTWFQSRLAVPAEAAPFRCFTETLHGMFEVRKMGAGWLRLRELVLDRDHDVTERRQLAGLARGDVLEARLIPFEGHLWFSAGFLCHPRLAIPAILREAKRWRKRETGRDPRDFTFECARRAVKAERYHKVPVEKIYDFQRPPPI